MGITTDIEIFLASTSPRRRQLLDQIGVRYQVVPIDVQERREAGESPADYVQRVALDKALAGWRSGAHDGGRPVLAADTEVVLDDEVLGKPVDEAHGLALLERLSGRSHQVLSAVAVVCGDTRLVRLSRSTVHFRAISATERQAYWCTGEPADKAGGYAIQGRGAVFVSHLQGSFSGVMGLPLYETAELLGNLGVSVIK